MLLQGGLKFLTASVFILFFSEISHAQNCCRLIGHRGGIVDSVTQENSRGSIRKAIQEKYWMVEIDLRITKDSVLVINHNPTLKQYYGKDAAISDLTWNEISQLRSALGERVLKFEEALQLCEGKIEVMVDNKLKGYDTLLFDRVLALLKKYHLLEHALMIGTDESTEYFTGKIKLSCTRQQLEANMKRKDYSPDHYYLFSDKITTEDAQWAEENNILAVGVLNSWRLRNAGIAETRQAAARLRSTGITHYQIDSKYQKLFRQKLN